MQGKMGIILFNLTCSIIGLLMAAAIMTYGGYKLGLALKQMWIFIFELDLCVRKRYIHKIGE